MPRGKLFKTKLQEKFLSGLEQFIANLKPNDLIDVGLIVGLAWTIKPTIDACEEISAKLQTVNAMHALAGKASSTYGIDLWKILRTVQPIVSVMDIIIASQIPVTEEQVKELTKTDWQSWVLAFVMAGIIVKFGADIIKSFGNILGLGKGLLGI